MTGTKLLVTALVITLVSLSAAPALAQSASPVRQNLQEGREELKNMEFGAAKADLRCSAVAARINARIDHYDKRKDDHLNRYQKVKNRVQRLVDRLEEKGYDTAQVKTDLTTLDTMLKDAADDYKVFITQLEETKQFDCADSAGAFKQALEEARTALEVFRADIKEIRIFVQSTLKEHVKALKDQNPNKGGVNE